MQALLLLPVYTSMEHQIHRAQTESQASPDPSDVYAHTPEGLGDKTIISCRVQIQARELHGGLLVSLSALRVHDMSSCSCRCTPLAKRVASTVNYLVTVLLWKRRAQYGFVAVLTAVPQHRLCDSQR